MNKCVVCGGEGISDAFYCFECTRLEKDRDGCPKIINLGSSRTDVSISFVVIIVSSVTANSLSYSTKRKQIEHSSSPGAPGIGREASRDWTCYHIQVMCTLNNLAFLRSSLS